MSAYGFVAKGISSMVLRMLKSYTPKVLLNAQLSSFQTTAHASSEAGELLDEDDWSFDTDAGGQRTFSISRSFAFV